MNLKTKDTKPKTQSTNPVPQTIMDFYNQEFEGLWKGSLLLTRERERQIKTRLKSFTVEELKAAITNLRQSAFHCGNNDKERVYGTPEYLFKNDSQDDHKNAEDVKGGAGQYFTPRPLIKAIVEVIRPEPGQTICDPACGTGGFLLAAHDYISENYLLDKEQKRFLKFNTFKGKDIVDGVARLCVMNLYLHGIGGDEIPIGVEDSLISDPGERFEIVLTNPPFGRKSSITIINGEGKAGREVLVYERQDFWATTSNKQLNFLQHVKTITKINGKVGIVVPDNVLFEGGAGETIRRKLLAECDVHTLLRLPTGVFYVQGVKANVLFFDRKPASEKPWTDKLWIYDLRTNMRFTLKTNPLKYDDLEDFIKCYNPENRRERKETERFKVFTYDDLIQRDKVSLDIFWLKDESLEDLENLPSPDIIASEIVENLESALEQFNGIYEDLEDEKT
jgi:type I restriction enzyme M protein